MLIGGFRRTPAEGQCVPRAHSAAKTAVSITTATTAFEAVKSTALPTNGWTSTDYAARPSAKEVKAVAMASTAITSS